MCTGLNLVTKDGKHIFGRSLDVTCSYGESVNIVPRNFEWLNVVDNKTYKTKYACIAMSIVVDNHPFLFDGVNEKGLAGGGLNFLSFAKFSDERRHSNSSAPVLFIFNICMATPHFGCNF